MSLPKLDGTGHSILVVDDDLAIRVLLQAVLKRMNFVVDLAEDGVAALEKLRQNNKYDLILLDLMMPRLNGYELIEEIADHFPEQRPHIVVFTAAGRRGVEKLPPETICASIHKPFDLDKFIEIVGQCMSQDHATERRQSSAPAAE